MASLKQKETYDYTQIHIELHMNIHVESHMNLHRELQRGLTQMSSCLTVWMKVSCVFNTTAIKCRKPHGLSFKLVLDIH